MDVLCLFEIEVKVVCSTGEHDEFSRVFAEKNTP